MTLSEARTPNYSGTTSQGEWERPSLSEYISAFATDEDSDASQVSDLSQESKRNIANRTFIGDPEADTEDELIQFPVVTSGDSLHESALEAAVSRAPQANISESTANSIQARARSLLEDEFDRELEESRNAERLEHTITLPGATARLADARLDGPGPWEVSGVALGKDEIVSHPEHGLILFSGEELEKAAHTLEGQPMTIDHPESEGGGIAYPPSIEDTVGRVTMSGYAESEEDGSGVFYNGPMSDQNIAEKVNAGILDVSPDLSYTLEGTDPRTGAKLAKNIRFIQLGFVSKGAGPQNSVQLGQSRALASLSAADIQTMLSDQQDAEEARLEDSDDPTDHPRAQSGDAVRWPSESGGSREPADWRYGVVVDSLADRPDDEILVAVYQPNADRDEWEPRGEQNVMNPDNLIPIGDGVAALPAISQLSMSDSDPSDSDPESSDGSESDSGGGADAEASTPEGDDAHPDPVDDDGQSTPVADDEDNEADGGADATADATDATDATDDGGNEGADADEDGGGDDGAGDEADADADADVGANDDNDNDNDNESETQTDETMSQAEYPDEATEADTDDDAQPQTENTGANTDTNTNSNDADAGADDDARQSKRSRQRLQDDLNEVKARLSDSREYIDSLEEQVENLESENARLSDAATGAAGAYAEALFADDGGPVTPEMAIETWTPEQLHEMYESDDEATLVEDSEPDVQGGDESPAEGASSEQGVDEDTQEEIERLEARMAEAKKQGFDGGARHYEARLSELRGTADPESGSKGGN